MSMEPRPSDDREEVEPAVRPLVPKGVLRGIEDINEGTTASLEDLQDATKF